MYLSNEKNNYAELQETILFTIDTEEQVHKAGTSWKHDRDYILDTENAKSAPKREECKAYLLKALAEVGGSMQTDALDAMAKDAGYSFSSIKRAKAELKREGKVRYSQTGDNKDRVWHIHVVESALPDFAELPEGETTPFDGKPMPF